MDECRVARYHYLAPFGLIGSLLRYLYYTMCQLVVQRNPQAINGESHHGLVAID